MKMLISAMLAAALFASNALAADIANPLAPGKPAGVKQAQDQEVSPLVYLGLGGIVAVVAIAASHSSHHNNGSTTTTVTTTTTTGTGP